MRKIRLKLEEKILIFISLTMIFGAGIYFVYALNWLGITLSLFLSLVTAIFIYKKAGEEIETDKASREKNTNKKFILILKSLYLIIALWLFLILIQNSSDQALISPWQEIPKIFFFLYFIATIILFLVIEQSPNRRLLPFIKIQYLISFSIAVIIYKIGYGFDPFIHGATMELIDSQGIVEPKTLYYLGQYSLIVSIHKITAIPIYWLNKLLVPILATIFLPGAILSFLNKRGISKRYLIVIIAALSLPINLFILSTPQNLTYIWLILTILYSLNGANKIIPLVFALATLSIHPLSGLPAMFFIAWSYIEKLRDKVSLFFYRLINITFWLISAVSLPISFTYVGGGTIGDLKLDLRNIFKLFNDESPRNNIADIFLNLPYLFNDLWLLIFIILSLTGFIIWFKRDKSGLSYFIKIIGALLISLILSASLEFSFLINYEREAYVSRIPVIIALFFLPAVLLSLDYLTFKIFRATKVEIFGGLILIVTAISSSLYLSYPRLDAYHNSKGYSVSSSDIEAVRQIEIKSEEPYIVLANQQTSVASLKEFGFDNYLKIKDEKVFFYPIPTGGKLYSYYLKMVNEGPKKETMKEAMDLTGVKESYLIISKYWWLSDRIIAAAKLSANDYWTTSDDNIYIFKYNY